MSLTVPTEHRTKVPLSLALLVVGVGGVVAQLVGGIAVATLIIADAIIQGGMPTETQAEAVASSTLGFALGAAGTSGVLMLASLGAPLLARVRVRESLGLRAGPAAVYPFAIVGALALGPVSDIFAQAMRAVAPDLTIGNIEVINEVVTHGNVVVIAFFIILAAPLAEELFFRGLLQGAIVTPWRAIAVSGIVFALFHVDPPHAVGVIPIGLFLAWLRHRTGSTVLTIVAHTVNNGAAMILTRTAPDLAGMESPLWLTAVGGAVALVCVAAVLYLTRRLETPPPA